MLYQNQYLLLFLRKNRSRASCECPNKTRENRFKGYTLFHLKLYGYSALSAPPTARYEPPRRQRAHISYGNIIKNVITEWHKKGNACAFPFFIHFNYWGIVAQSFMNFSRPLFVRGWSTICMITLKGTVATSAPALASSITCTG